MSVIDRRPKDHMVVLACRCAALEMQLQSLVWASHTILSVNPEKPVDRIDLRILRNEVRSAEELLEGAK